MTCIPGGRGDCSYPEHRCIGKGYCPFPWERAHSQTGLNSPLFMGFPYFMVIAVLVLVYAFNRLGLL